MKTAENYKQFPGYVICDLPKLGLQQKFSLIIINTVIITFILLSLFQIKNWEK
jgi:hypothetical protein